MNYRKDPYDSHICVWNKSGHVNKKNVKLCSICGKPKGVKMVGICEDIIQKRNGIYKSGRLTLNFNSPGGTKVMFDSPFDKKPEEKKRANVRPINKTAILISCYFNQKNMKKKEEKKVDTIVADHRKTYKIDYNLIKKPKCLIRPPDTILDNYIKIVKK